MTARTRYQDLAGVWSVHRAGSAPVPMQVPGDVHSALVAAGLLEHPFTGRNVEAAQWVERVAWVLRREVTVPDRPASATRRDLLRLDGVDLRATVSLDGRVVGRHANAFRPFEADVTELLTAGRHDLEIRLDPAGAATAVDRQWGFYAADERVPLRKPGAQFSWDHAPRLVNVGVLGDVRIVTHDRGRILTPHVRVLRADTALAVVTVDVPVEQWAPGDLEVVVRLHGHGTSVETATRPGRAVTLTVDDPELWWPAGAGRQPLYTVEVALRDGDDVLDSWSTRVGLRRIELDRSPDPDEVGAERFTFVVNGRRIFAKGANWVPDHLLTGSSTPERADGLLTALADAHANMVRVWGGGRYEPDAFYDRCDELGLLVWQDFMLACARYPDDDAEFVREVGLEAVHQVRRLRSHACLALWCGSNEVDWLEDLVVGLVPGVPFPGSRVVHDVLASAVGAEDPDTAWWPCSPYGGDQLNSDRAGDRHNWTTWHGLTDSPTGVPLPWKDGAFVLDGSPPAVGFHHLDADRSRFLSEFGAHAAPVLRTLRQFLGEGDLDPHGPELRFRNRNGDPDRIHTFLQAHTGAARDVRSFVDLSMWCQAETLTRGIETSRRRKWSCSGVLFWQWNDAWPAVSWSVIDVLGRPKAGYFAVKRAFAPVIVTAHEDGDRYTVTVVNDTADAVEDTITWELASLDGRVHERGERTVTVPPGSAVAVGSVQAPRGADRSRTVLWMSSLRGLVPDNRRLFADLRDLDLPQARVDVRWEPVPGGVRGTVTADALALAVHVEHPSSDLTAGDDWFDLFPGRPRTVTFRAAEHLDPDDLTVAHLGH